MTGCPFSTGAQALPEPPQVQLPALEGPGPHVVRREHPAGRHGLRAQIAGSAGVAAGRRDRFAAAVEGFVRTWGTLPASVNDITVIRDTPRIRGNLGGRRAARDGPPAARRCAARCPGGEALDADPAVVAATAPAPARVGVVHLTPFFCGAERCFPVIGGVLVFSDESHLTRTFARSLAPYLARALDRVGLRALGASGDRTAADSLMTTRHGVGCHHADRPGTIDLRGAGTIGIRLVRGLPEPSRARPAAAMGAVGLESGQPRARGVPPR